jgi:hypothetical protein
LIAFREYQKCEKFEIKVPTQNLEVWRKTKSAQANLWWKSCARTDYVCNIWLSHQSITFGKARF